MDDRPHAHPAADPAGADETPAFRPSERLWPYVDVPEQPSPEEIAALDPDLQAALFGHPQRPFSITLVFPPFDAPDYPQALALARGAREYRETGEGASLRHRARFEPGEGKPLHALFDIVGRLDACEVLIDDQPIPYARELWLPLVWLVIHARG